MSFVKPFLDEYSHTELCGLSVVFDRLVEGLKLNREEDIIMKRIDQEINN